MSGTCIYKPCNDLEWWDGEKCQFVYNGSGCDGDNVRRWYNLTGGITCDCEYGWARQTSQGECQQYSTQAWCPEGQLLQVKGQLDDRYAIHRYAIHNICDSNLTMSYVSNFQSRSDSRVSNVRPSVRPSVMLFQRVKIKRQIQASKSSVKTKRQNQASKSSVKIKRQIKSQNQASQ